MIRFDDARPRAGSPGEKLPGAPGKSARVGVEPGPLTLHPQGCPAHQSVQGAIEVAWGARVRVGEEIGHFPGGAEPTAAWS